MLWRARCETAHGLGHYIEEADVTFFRRRYFTTAYKRRADECPLCLPASHCFSSHAPYIRHRFFKIPHRPAIAPAFDADYQANSSTPRALPAKYAQQVHRSHRRTPVSKALTVKT